ncbi:threonine--tRNA ligase [Sutterella faecalis]|uniref:Threonine--tRNA ligase n=2 Tax=Sutterella TaxID=40544 RepID=A0AAI9SCH3_9BURK|nr:MULTISPECIES: threonine--tRNA ligase [Sutterella]KAB7650631.1 threonine--tRNA ligase [Sutterella seckii]QDA54525.1 threonine--tRNA ligase [Sutterella faecalis]
MVVVTLPDGSKREYADAVTVGEIAASIGAGLAKAALAGKVDGKLVDLSHKVTADAAVSIITGRDPEGLEIIRHSTAHLMAQAVKELFPEAQVTIGPAIENGFYYDFSYSRPFTPEDLQKIEERMDELVKKNIPIVREEMPRNEAVDFFKALGEHYKAEIISSIPEGETISLYRQGDFVDLCRGPHVPSTGVLKVHRLMKVAGAYWRGDSKNEMLQRIYGTAWATKDEQKAYLKMLEEAEKRDHRRLGRELDLFHLQDEAPGMIFWHARGWALWQVIEQYMRRVYQDNGYDEVKAPQLLDRSLWERSGHWAKYRENMFTTESENRYYALKPMNCPGHIQLFNSKLRSYRDLPLRFGEFGQCHRNEPSGALHGLMRVRGFTQDDGHIFCTEDQILAECEHFTGLVQKVYADFGFKEIAYKVATRPAMRIGEDAVWDKAEHALMSSLDALGIKYEILEGEGAFYGPKIEYHLKDCLGRSWQCGTVQVDFQMPGRLGAEYVAEDNTRKVPVMLHRAILGSLERWIGMLIEEFAGAFPVWLAPVQCAVAPITDGQAEYAKSVAEKLHNARIRVISDLRGEKINYKIRELSLQKIPYILVVGEKEAQAGTVSVRMRGGKDLGVMKVEDFLNRILAENESRGSGE